jgi:galactokinase
VNYVQAAYKGVFEHLQRTHPDATPTPKGLNLMIHGEVPQGAAAVSAMSHATTCISGYEGVYVVGLRFMRRVTVIPFHTQ